MHLLLVFHVIRLVPGASFHVVDLLFFDQRENPCPFGSGFQMRSRMPFDHRLTVSIHSLVVEYVPLIDAVLLGEPESI